MLFGGLSKDMKYTIIRSIFGERGEHIWLLNDKDPSFAVMLVPLMVPMQVVSDTSVWEEGEHPD